MGFPFASRSASLVKRLVMMNRKIDARILADAVLRFHHLSTRSHLNKTADLLWSIEPEIVFDAEGRELIPRLEPDSAANARYNSFKRTVTRDVDIANSGLVVHKDENNNYTLHEEHSLSESFRFVVVGAAKMNMSLNIWK